MGSIIETGEGDNNATNNTSTTPFSYQNHLPSSCPLEVKTEW